MLITRDSLTFSGAATGSMAGNLTSDSQQLENMFGYSVQAIYTGSPVGTLTLEASDDNSHWATVDDSDQAVSGSGNGIWNVTSSNYTYVRVVYSFTSGSGTLSLLFRGRGF